MPSTITFAGVTVARQSALVAALGAATSAALFAMAWFAGPLRRVLLVASLAYLLITLYAAYMTNCVVAGRCVALSWLFVSVYALYAAFVPISLALLVARLPR